MTDIEIAHSVKMKNIKQIAKKLGYKKGFECYGNFKAKLPVIYGKKHGKLILVTAMSPTKMGIGKTTVSIGLADALCLLHKKACLALREPSLGPVFGIKGGATGGGYSQVVPMEDINLHFNGDFHAITSANNLLCSLIDNHIFQGNELNLDPEKILFKRCIDLNDRALRDVVVACGEKNGTERKDGFVITAASEIMAILCLATDFEDLKTRLGNIAVAIDKNGNLVYARDLKAQESMAILLKDAFKPNLVQTLAGTPALVHGGPFANIAHGCNSIVATKMALSYADYVVTEAGFGADLGAEKFFDIKCRIGNLKPSVAVLVATISSLKLHGGIQENELATENISAVKLGLSNLMAHIDSLKNNYKLPVVVTLNKYKTDTQSEIDEVINRLNNFGIKCVVNDVWAQGGKGAIDLAKEVLKCGSSSINQFEPLYQLSCTTTEKIEKICKQVYGASSVEYSNLAMQKLEEIKKLKLDNLPVVIAKTQFSLSDNKNLLGRPENFAIHITDLQIKTGAGFVVALAGNMLLMPGLSKTPNATNMKIYGDGTISGLI